MHDIVSPTAECHLHSHTHNRFAVIPTPDKLKADLKFTGRGVRIAFLDSGFYPHPDFRARVVAFHDIHGEDRTLDSVIEPQGHHWHGTQTVVSCAGDGSLSNRLYKGIAHEAELVLVKVSRSGRIDDQSIVAGLEWIIDNHEIYDICILNISLGGDMDAKTSESRINQLCERLVAEGVTITVASGNSSESCTMPPASSPSVITVGGYSDENQFKTESFDLYHSSFGKTADGNIKPEIIAPAMYVAAPILPNTQDYDRAQTLSMLSVVPDFSFATLLIEYWEEAGFDREILNVDLETARRSVEYALQQHKIVATHYQHVDGTSFAAPITASVVAQMLEANPKLTPAAIKNILVVTAQPLDSKRALRQGSGMLRAKRAVELAESENHFETKAFTAPKREGHRIVFTFHDDHASKVNLAGDFNSWNMEMHSFEKTPNGLWTIAIHFPEKIRIHYKILIDGTRWIEDPTHGIKEDNGFGGFHSVLEI